jgi:hypothetical protein
MDKKKRKRLNSDDFDFEMISHLIPGVLVFTNPRSDH